MDWLNSLPDWLPYALIGGGLPVTMWGPEAIAWAKGKLAGTKLPFTGGDAVLDAVQKLRERAIARDSTITAKDRDAVLHECDCLEDDYAKILSRLEPAK